MVIIVTFSISMLLSPALESPIIKADSAISIRLVVEYEANTPMCNQYDYKKAKCNKSPPLYKHSTTPIVGTGGYIHSAVKRQSVIRKLYFRFICQLADRFTIFKTIKFYHHESKTNDCVC